MEFQLSTSNFAGNTPRVLHYVGELAYFEAFGAGLVPCKVIGVQEGYNRETLVQVRLTASRSGYRRGEVLLHPAQYIVPRANYRRAWGSQRIFGAWTWLPAREG